MSYVVLARKWRPMGFEDLVGQDHVARTLANAIESGRVAHAFLFTGVRGVGKTTSARILAKALNCKRPPGSTPPGTDPGPTVTPCLQCEPCREITIGTDVDVREIDGASYTGVDDVRKLQDSLPYRPARDRYKIVIVDEVHMLSQNAWNAFLKTLEEPPPHVKFIFATTEVHKVPITILSRVQRFDFKLIPTRTIANRLRHVLTEEGIESDESAISIVAREAAGSMRDAMSLLDQVIAWGGQKLVGDDVARVLGVASRAALQELGTALVRGDAAACLQIVGSLADQGHDLPHVARDLLALLRDLVVAKVCPDPKDLLDLADEEQTSLKTLAADVSVDDVLRLHQGFSAGFDEVTRSGQPRAALEMLLVRLSRRPPLVPVDDLIARLGGLEKRLSGSGNGGGGGGLRPQAPPNRSAGQSRPRARDPRSSTPQREAAAEHREEPPGFSASIAEAPPMSSTSPKAVSAPAASSPKPLSAPTANERSEWDSFRPANLMSGGSAPTLKAVPSASPKVAPRAAVAVRSSGASASAVAEEQRLSPEASLPSTLALVVPPSALPDSRPESEPPRLVPSSPVRVREAQVSEPCFEQLRAIVQQVREAAPQVAAYLEQTAPFKIEPGELVLGVEPGSFFSDELAGTEARELVEQASKDVLGVPTRLTLELDSARALTADTLAARANREREEKRQNALTEARNHPRITDAIEVLGARLKDIRLAED